MPATAKAKAKAPASYTVVRTRTRDGGTSEYTGNMGELRGFFGYTLETGASYSHEKGNSKINLKPGTISSLITNLNKAVNNSAANGYAGITFHVK